MKKNTMGLLLAFTALAALSGCGGESVRPDDGTNSGGGGGSSSGSNSSSGTSAGGVSYLPLTVLEVSKDYSGLETDNLFSVEYPGAPAAGIIPTHIINPVDAATLATVTNAVGTDYKVTIDGIDLGTDENHLTLQKLIDPPMQLQTALVFDVSDSVNAVNFQALIAEAKAYIDATQSSTNSAIKNQQFVVWAFATDTEELTTGFTSNATTVKTALDAVLARYNARVLGPNSNLHKVMIEAIGRYKDDTKQINFGADGDNDLIDFVGMNGTQLGQMVVFSAGADNWLEFSDEDMKKAIQSQAFIKYDTTTGALSNKTVNLYKPVFYYVLGGTSPSTAYPKLSALATSTTNLTLNSNSNSYSFGSDLISRQVSAINARVDLNNQYVFRYVFTPRVNDHVAVFLSNATGYNFSLTTSFDEDGLLAVNDAPPLLEITGASGEYLSNDSAYFSHMQNFVPVTRWTNTPFSYTWTPGSGVTGTTNGDGSFTVTGISGASGSLTVSNGTNTKAITIYNQ